MKIKRLIYYLIPVCVLLLLLLFTYSCKSDEYEEWRIMNDNWYNRAKVAYADSVGYQMSSSGLIYKIIEPGYQRRPNDNSYVNVRCTGKFIDGKVFENSDSTWINMYIYGMGWREALKLIQDGGHIKFIMPYSIGYGGTDSGIVPPYSALIFDVKLYESRY